ncbi:MAG: hypothetical protein AAF810_13690 [Cyanobacteria bacterium P01_D01_bin.36]
MFSLTATSYMPTVRFLSERYAISFRTLCDFLSERYAIAQNTTVLMQYRTY